MLERREFIGVQKLPVIGRTEKSFLNFKQRDFYNVLTRPHLTREIVTIEPLYFISTIQLLVSLWAFVSLVETAGAQGILKNF